VATRGLIEEGKVVLLSDARSVIQSTAKDLENNQLALVVLGLSGKLDRVRLQWVTRHSKIYGHKNGRQRRALKKN
jgi:hypothetical protein